MDPALASDPARDFERPLGAVERLDGQGGKRAHGGPVTHRSAPVAAPAFEAVGLAGEMRPVEIRARPGGGGWTDWFEVGGGDPLFVVGGAERAQLRTRGWRPEGRLHFVAVPEPAPGGKRGRRALESPRMISRRGWGAPGGCEPRGAPYEGRVKAIAIHHTVTSNLYARSEARGIVLAICRYHRNANGWNDIGYNALVDRFGRLFEGRAGGRWRPIAGAHAEGYNAQTAGIAVLGDHSTVRPPDAVLGGLSRYIAYRLQRLGFRAYGRPALISGGGGSNRFPAGTRVRVGRIFRHRDVGITACPGDALAGLIGVIRRKVERRMTSQPLR